MSSRTARLAVCVLTAAAWVSAGASAQPMGKTKEYRSLNTDLYKISIQKDGRLDVSLATDTAVISDVFPMIWFDGEREPERLPIKGAWTERYLVEDKLGQGQGIHHQYKGSIWSLRAYPTRPYIAVQLGYMNESKRPVRIKALLPWCVGAPGKGLLMLGPGTNDARILTDIATGDPVAVQGAARSADAIAILNGITGQSLISGFITQDRAHGSIELGEPVAEDKKSPSGLAYFRAVSMFEPPIELAPGETLYSEVLYLAISEPDPVVGIQRYARAVQVANGLAGPDHDAPLHAWTIPSDGSQSLEELTAQLRRAKAAVPLDAIGHVLIGSPAKEAQTVGIDPRVVSVVREEGYIPVLWYDPLAGGFDSTTNPGTDAQRAKGAGLRRTYGPVSVAGLRPHVAWQPGEVPAQTMIRTAWTAFREGLGPGARLYGVEASLLASTLLDGVVTRAEDALFLSPQPSRHSVYFGSAGDHESFRARIAAAVLMKCGVLIPLDRANDEAATVLLDRVLPSPQVAARPIDLFAAQPPRAYHLRAKMPDGDVHVAAVINWDTAAPRPVTLPWAGIGFTAGAYYTVYDYWSQQYLGSAVDTVDVTIPAGGASILVFRPLLSHPMLVSTGANLGQDAPALRRVDWDPTARTLRVEFDASAGSRAAPGCTLAVPAPYRLVGVAGPGSIDLDWEATGASANIKLLSTPGKPQEFTAQFEVVR